MWITVDVIILMLKWNVRLHSFLSLSEVVCNLLPCIFLIEMELQSCQTDLSSFSDYHVMQHFVNMMCLHHRHFS